MSEFMKRRFGQFTPVEKLSEMDIIEVEKSCHIAFEIIGYKPYHFDEAFKKAWENSTAEYLSDFIYCVWRCDDAD